MAEQEPKRQTRQDILNEGWGMTGLSVVGIVSAIGLNAIGFLKTPIVGEPPVALGDMLEALMGYSALFLGMPMGITEVAAGYLTRSSDNPTETNVAIAQWFLGGAAVTGGAVLAELGASISFLANKDPNTATYWLAAAPLTGYVSRRLWQGAISMLRR